MAGIKGRSGPPGNLNNVRNPHNVFWKRRALRPQDRWVATEVDAYRAGLLRDRPDPTEAEKRAIELASESKACRLLIWRAIREAGFTEQGKDGLRLVPAAEALPKFIGTELGALKLLGLQRRAKQVNDLALAICEDINREEAVEEAQP